MQLEMKNTRHYQKAKKVLKEFRDAMESRHYKTIEDKTWPFHVLVPTEDNRMLSIYCSGFNAVLEIQPLRKNGEVDRRYKERAYEGFGGLYNYLTKNWFLTIT